MRRAACLLLVPLLLVACGGGGGKALSRTDYIKQADGICQRYNDTVKKLPSPEQPPEIVDFTNKSIAALDKALAEERKLEPPKQLVALKTRWLAEAQVVRDDMAAVRESARRIDLIKIQQALRKGQSDDARSNALAAQLGLKVCSKP